jgi:hypothetical protein
MTDRPFRVIDGGGSPEPDPEAVATGETACSMIRDAMKADGVFWAMIGTAEGYEVVFYGDAMEVCTYAEELSRELKRRGMGLDE